MINHKFFPHTQEDIKKMLEEIQVDSIEDLFSDLPKEILLNKLEIDSMMEEGELVKYFKKLSSKNKQLISFLGCGCYESVVSSVSNSLISRQEFLTAYTPYQPEISQGTLQYIFEYQSLVCELTGLDCSNASMYDGATALVESIIMATSHTRKNKVIISKTINPKLLEVVNTYFKYKKVDLIYLEEDNYTYSLEHYQNISKDDVACCVFQYPNFYGYLEDYSEIKEMLVLNCELKALSVLKTPKEFNASICCGDAMSMGLDMAFGGPYLGYIACKSELVRKLPGRIVGLSNDSLNNRAFCLTLQAREQHIRREKATSNICSNQSLMALKALIYANLLGPSGLVKTQEKSFANSHLLEQLLLETNDFKKVTDKKYLKEFVLEYRKDPQLLNEYLENNGYLGGYILKGNRFIFCCTETRTETEIKDFVDLIRRFNS